MPSRRLWIDQYLRLLLSDPPAGTQTSSARNGEYPGVRINGGAVRLELYAHDDYVRVGILSTDPSVFASVRGLPGFEITKPAKKWFTGYIRDERGIAAINRLVTGATNDERDDSRADSQGGKRRDTPADTTPQRS